MPTDLHRPDPSHASPAVRESFRSLGILTLLVLFGIQSAWSADPAGEDHRLVPGALGVRTDGRGNTWNLEQNGSIGRVGTTMVNTGLVLEVNGEKFVAYQPMMTADGEAIVLQGRPIDSLPGLQVQRRIRILGETGGLRYAEMFFNGSTDTLSINVALVSNFSGNYKTFMTDRGRTEPVLLGAEESGVIVLPGATQSTRAFLFSLAEEDAPIKPTISARNRYAMTFQYALTLAPGETAILLHQVAQTVIPQSFERRRLLSLFSPHDLKTAGDQLPAEWQKYLRNAGGSEGMGRSLFQLEPGRASLGVEPVKQDLLLIGGETRLLGKVESSSLELKSLFGKTPIDTDELYGLQGEGDSGLTRSYFRNGEILLGEISADQLVLVPSGGGEIEIDGASLDRLVFAEKKELDPWGDEVAAVIDTYQGERIAIRNPVQEKLRFVTAWGLLETSMENVVWIGATQHSGGVLEIELKNGTRCFGRFEDGELAFQSVRFGSISLDSNWIRSVFTPFSESRDRWGAASAAGTLLYLLGDQILAGEPTSPIVSVQTGETTIDTEFAQIRSLSISSSNGADKKIQIDRWDGGLVSGVSTQSVLSFRVGENVWRVPLRDLERVETASPQLTDEVRSEIDRFLLLLGSDSWEERESASRELGAFGYLAAPFLKKHLQVTDDPEVKRRLERILAELN
ncbi:MAG: hypothetical protein P1U85_03575 [Verrucomicrobiales bacterium]|nr:hypothetical protein [Verrucomicrobiales bacterium]